MSVYSIESYRPRGVPLASPAPAQGRASSSGAGTFTENQLHQDVRVLLRVAEIGDINAMPFRIQVRRTLDAIEGRRQALRHEWEAETRRESPSMRRCAGFRDRELAMRELALQLLGILNQVPPGPRGAA